MSTSGNSTSLIFRSRALKGAAKSWPVVATLLPTVEALDSGRQPEKRVVPAGCRGKYSLPGMIATADLQLCQLCLISETSALSCSPYVSLKAR